MPDEVKFLIRFKNDPEPAVVYGTSINDEGEILRIKPAVGQHIVYPRSMVQDWTQICPENLPA